MKIKRIQTYQFIKLSELKYGDCFEYNDEIYIKVNPKHIKPDCMDTIPIVGSEGNVFYLCTETNVIYYPNAELCLGNAFKG